MKELLIIDNAPLREDPIRRARKWLGKIEETELSVQKFYGVDSKLFAEWSQKITAPIEKKIESVQAEFVTLAERHDFLVSVSDKLNISVPMAYLFLKKEEERYHTADPQTRQEIEKIREDRLKYHQKAIHQAMEDHFDFFGDEEELDPGSFSTKKEKVQSKKQNFQMDFFSFKEERHKEEERIKLKSLHRKIVRILHPDHLKLDESKNLKSWFDRIWRDVAHAAQNQDLEKLTQIHHKVVVALDQHEDLTLTELELGAQALESEFKALAKESSKLKKNPAWNFSSFKNFVPLEKEVVKPYLAKIKFLYENIEDLKETHAQIEMTAKRIERQGSAPSRARTRSRSRTRKKSDWDMTW